MKIKDGVSEVERKEIGQEIVMRNLRGKVQVSLKRVREEAVSLQSSVSKLFKCIKILRCTRIFNRNCNSR